jgi:hypothetical protein
VLVTVAGGLGRPSSLDEPNKLADAGKVIVWSVPAFAVGVWFTGTTTGFTVMVSVSLAERTLSDAVNFKTYVPAWPKDAVVDRLFALPKVTVPGPDTLLQVFVNAAGGFGRPSSLDEPNKLADAGKVIV